MIYQNVVWRGGTITTFSRQVVPYSLYWPDYFQKASSLFRASTRIISVDCAVQIYGYTLLCCYFAAHWFILKPWRSRGTVVVMNGYTSDHAAFPTLGSKISYFSLEMKWIHLPIFKTWFFLFRQWQLTAVKFAQVTRTRKGEPTYFSWRYWHGAFSSLHLSLLRTDATVAFCTSRRA